MCICVVSDCWVVKNPLDNLRDMILAEKIPAVNGLKSLCDKLLFIEYIV